MRLKARIVLMVRGDFVCCSYYSRFQCIRPTIWL